MLFRYLLLAEPLRPLDLDHAGTIPDDADEVMEELRGILRHVVEVELEICRFPVFEHDRRGAEHVKLIAAEGVVALDMAEDLLGRQVFAELLEVEARLLGGGLEDLLSAKVAPLDVALAEQRGVKVPERLIALLLRGMEGLERAQGAAVLRRPPWCRRRRPARPPRRGPRS
jgi:hypothetical protein